MIIKMVWKKNLKKKEIRGIYADHQNHNNIALKQEMCPINIAKMLHLI